VRKTQARRCKNLKENSTLLFLSSLDRRLAAVLVLGGTSLSGYECAACWIDLPARGDCRKRLFWTSRIRATRSHKSFAVVFVTLLFGYREMNQPSPELGQQRRLRSLPSWREL